MKKLHARAKQLTGVLLQVGATLAFVELGTEGWMVDFPLDMLLIGAALSAASLVLWGRGTIEARDKLDGQIDGPERPVDQQLVKIREQLSLLQEDRDFYRSLYSGGEKDGRTLQTSEQS